jgi:hypothetical protein
VTVWGTTFGGYLVLRPIPRRVLEISPGPALGDRWDVGLGGYPPLVTHYNDVHSRDRSLDAELKVAIISKNHGFAAIDLPSVREFAGS